MAETMSLVEFITHTEKMLLKVHEATEHALETAAKVVEKEAKAEIGTYQGQIGQFAGWAELAESTKADRVNQGFSENDPGLRTGEMRDSIHHQVHASGIASGAAEVGSDEDKMVYFELGTSKQPPRSVLGGAAMRKEREVQLICGEAVVAALLGHNVVKKLY